MRRAQVFTTDFAFAVIIMTGAVLTLVAIEPWSTPTINEDRTLVERLMTEGVPADWNTTTVLVPGFLSGVELNTTKVDFFASFTDEERTRLLDLSRNAAFRVYHNGSVYCNSCGTVPADASSLLVIRRYAMLNGSLARIEVSLYS